MKQQLKIYVTEYLALDVDKVMNVFAGPRVKAATQDDATAAVRAALGGDPTARAIGVLKQESK